VVDFTKTPPEDRAAKGIDPIRRRLLRRSTGPRSTLFG